MNPPASLSPSDAAPAHASNPGRGVYTRLPPSRLERLAQRLRWPLTGAAGLASLYLVFLMHAAGQTWLALGALGFFVLVFYIYISQAAFALRYLFPGIAGMLIFIAFPLIYTAQIGFTNYSSAHLLSQERVREYLLDQHEAVPGQTQAFTLHADGPEFRLVLRAEDGSPSWVSPALALKTTRQELSVDMLPAQSAQQPLTAPLQQALPLRELIEHREALMQLKLRLPGAAQELRYLGLREFGAISRHWQAKEDGSLLRLADQTRFSPNLQTGYFESASGEVQQPGFKVVVGWRNYTRMVMDAEFRGPFLAIFSWTVLFSALTVICATAIGMLLAVLLNWDDLKFRGTYRTLLFLPYAVPGFISILVFKGLFNQNFGEINAILDALLGIKPAWFADPLLAKVMLLIVNVWLGYPYIMILCAGLLKSIPADLYEASAIAGAGPLTNFFKITAPLVIKPLAPLLVSAFAFNFNNFVLIALLTDGRPDFLSTKIPAGQTDILVSYTYRIAFKDSGSDFGLAAAISTLIFFLVAAMSLINLRLMRKANS
ncbi:maltose ABC transporter permease MalF [Paucibacter aquatile]|uniref:Maltose/maltodextrin transport system permease protein n=1 Tax=Kinneretia aquatilis TaxID=2070761 RepID=A0A2N8KS31_9BURK|nr:maltose ABC transporter permease MalF [Paucibacter aquatile]PND36259.1 maltose ABC transporter permease MalF [Paucibacter aquatile]